METEVFLDESFAPSSISADDTHTHYQFDIGEEYNVLPVGSLSFGFVDVIAAEVPIAVASELMISGSLLYRDCLLYTSPSPRDQRGSRMPSSA